MRQLQDQDRMEDLLASEKAMIQNYNLFATECATQTVQDTFLDLLQESHRMKTSVFEEMRKRGWYPTPAAEQVKMEQARQKFENQRPL